VAGVLGLIPARGGSKGIPNKNLRPLAGKPLLQYAADSARESRAFDRLVLSTDSEEIAAAGRRLGLEVPFLRPAEIAQDETPMVAVVRHAVDFLEEQGWSPEIVVLLQPTSPLRQARHIRAALALLHETGADAVASVTEVPRHLSPDYVMRIEDGRLVPFLPEGARVARRQDARVAHVRDGTIYAFRRSALAETGSIYGRDCRPLVLRAAECLTLDTLEDWQAAELRLQSSVE
jgi:CMP-N-acetylneuraminic acid synthetase